MEFVVNTINEIITTSDFTNTKRLYEIIAETKSQMQMYLTGAGHQAAYIRAGSYTRSYLKYQDEIEGIGQYQFIESLEHNFETLKDEVVSSLKELSTYIFRKENLLISYTGDNDDYKKYLPELINNLYNKDIVKERYLFVEDVKNEGFKTPGQVQYVARCGNFGNVGEYSGAFLVFGMALRYDYLWTQVRVLGGA